MQVQKRKNEKNNAKIREKKKKKGAKKYTQALRKVKCTYAKKNYFISELNTAILKAF